MILACPHPDVSDYPKTFDAIPFTTKPATGEQLKKITAAMQSLSVKSPRLLTASSRSSLSTPPAPRKSLTPKTATPQAVRKEMSKYHMAGHNAVQKADADTNTLAGDNATVWEDVQTLPDDNATVYLSPRALCSVTGAPTPPLRLHTPHYEPGTGPATSLTGSSGKTIKNIMIELRSTGLHSRPLTLGDVDPDTGKILNIAYTISNLTHGCVGVLPDDSRYSYKEYGHVGAHAAWPGYQTWYNIAADARIGEAYMGHHDWNRSEDIVDRNSFWPDCHWRELDDGFKWVERGNRLGHVYVEQLLHEIHVPDHYASTGLTTMFLKLNGHRHCVVAKEGTMLVENREVTEANRFKQGDEVWVTAGIAGAMYIEGFLKHKYFLPIRVPPGSSVHEVIEEKLDEVLTRVRDYIQMYKERTIRDTRFLTTHVHYLLTDPVKVAAAGTRHQDLPAAFKTGSTFHLIEQSKSHWLMSQSKSSSSHAYQDASKNQDSRRFR